MGSPVLLFDRGTLLLEAWGDRPMPPRFRFDERVGMPRAPASAYRQLVTALHRSGEPYTDDARKYVELERALQTDRTPRDYQIQSVEAWDRAGRRGLVVLPTGSGKSLVAQLCIACAQRSALVVAPTLDLVSQWYDGLLRAFGGPIGVCGGGSSTIEDITVTTYDSAHLRVEALGPRFGLVVFDEVHHLPGETFRRAAEGSLAPWRLGLTATLEREDGAHEDLEHLVGPVVLRRDISELAGHVLAPYRTEVIRVQLDADERRVYEDLVARHRAYRARLGHLGDFRAYIREASKTKEGRMALQALRESRRILHHTRAKTAVVAELLAEHASGRSLVFTNDNASAFDVSRSLLLPAITHRTDIKERQFWLQAYRDGDVRTLVASRVLNEGVDLPEAEVAIVMAGTSTVREHVQRLGRILRPKAGKQAILYELVVADSAEERASARRRAHEAYGA